MTIADAGFITRDYSLTGPEGQRAMEIGLTSAEWYHSEVPRKTMIQLMQRNDSPALRDTIIWLGLLALAAIGDIIFWGTWWAVPFFFVYGVLYGSACDSRWHECGHGTAFRTAWMNDVVYHIASFMVMRNPVSWRWSHSRHHTDTIIVGRDPEIAIMRPPALILGALHFIGIPDIFLHFRILVKNALGIITPDERNYIPESDWPKIIFWARVHVVLQVDAIILAIIMRSIFNDLAFIND